MAKHKITNRQARAFMRRDRIARRRAVRAWYGGSKRSGCLMTLAILTAAILIAARPRRSHGK